MRPFSAPPSSAAAVVVVASSSPSTRRQSRPRPTSSAMAAAAGSSGQIRPFPSWIRPVGGRISAMAARHRPSRLGVAVPVRLVVSIPAASRGLIPAARRGLILAASRGSSLSPASCPRVVARKRTSSAPPSRFGAPPLLCSSVHPLLRLCSVLLVLVLRVQAVRLCSAVLLCSAAFGDPIWAQVMLIWACTCTASAVAFICF